MNRQLILLRHAKSDWTDPNLVDFKRPLSERGFLSASYVAQWFKLQGYDPDYTFCSPATRTRQTFEALERYNKDAAKIIKYDKSLYLADCYQLLDMIKSAPNDCAQILLIGHNPGLEDLLVYLADSDIALTKKGKLLTTAAFAVLSIPDAWQTIEENCARVTCFKRPKALKQVLKNEHQT